MLTLAIDFNSLSPHDVLKHDFAYLRNDLIPSNLGGFKTKILIELFQLERLYLSFVTHIMSSSSTTSRELGQQFADCSGRK